MMFDIYSADVTGVPSNCSYPHKTTVTDEENLIKAVCRDYVCAEYKDSYRNNENFIGSNCLPVDCDNDHSEKSEDWITPKDVQEAFPNVKFAVHYSRNNNRKKKDKAARPKFHILFPIAYCTDAEQYGAMKKIVSAMFPYFDTKALDAARFFYGTNPAEVEIFDGELTLSDFINNDLFGDEDFDEITDSSVIAEGSRNSTMSRYAGRIIKKYGDTEKAFECFMEKAECCEPPLEESELMTIWHSAQRFYEKLSQQEGYIPPEEYNGEYGFKPADYSDIGQARVLSDYYKDELAYTDATDYMRYNGIRWAESRQGAVGACEDFLDMQLDEAEAALQKAKDKLVKAGIDKGIVAVGGKALEKEIGYDTKKYFDEYKTALTYYAFVMKRRDMKYVVSALQAAKPMLLKGIDEFDTQGYQLNTPFATYDLSVGVSSAKDHCAEDYITKVTAVSPDTENMDLWLDAVNQFFCGDKELMDYVQQTVGLAAIGKIAQEGIIIAYGDGSNGKSTFWNTIAQVLGSYSGSLSSDALIMNCKRNVKPELAELRGKRLIIASELEEGTRLNTAIVKQLTSTDPIIAEKKYKDPFTFIPIHTVVLYTNHLPKVGANDEGIWRRLIVIPFNAKIKGKKDIKNYTEYLFKNAGGAVLTWIIEGAKKVIANDMKPDVPKVVTEAIGKYREQNDWMAHFLDECCEIDKRYTQKSGELYEEYRMYCARNGEYTRSTTDFYTRLESLGYIRKRTKAGIAVLGLRLKSDFLE